MFFKEKKLTWPWTTAAGPPRNPGKFIQDMFLKYRKKSKHYYYTKYFNINIALGFFCEETRNIVLVNMEWFFLLFFQSPQSKCLLFHSNNIFILNFGYYIMHRMCISTDLDTNFRILVINSVRNRFRFWGSSFLGSKRSVWT